MTTGADKSLRPARLSSPLGAALPSRHAVRSRPRRRWHLARLALPRAETSSLMRVSNLTVPIMPTLRPKLRKVPRRSFSMVMALDNQRDAHCCPDYACGSPLCATVIS